MPVTAPPNDCVVKGATLHFTLFQALVILGADGPLSAGATREATMPIHGAGTREKPGLRMKELMAASGLPKSTLLYYVEHGLLPAPVKTSPNMAYYHPSCVERAPFIKDLQVNHRLPLDKIKKLLDLRDQGQEVAPLVEMLHLIFGPTPERLLSLKELCRRSGLSREEVEAWRTAGLLRPRQEHGFDQQDLAMAVSLAGAGRRGITPRDLAFYPRLGREIVAREMKLRGRLIRRLELPDNIQVTMQMVRAARATRAYVIDRIFQEAVRDSRLREED